MTLAETVTSVNGTLIRLTSERWSHITEEHSELAGMRFEVLETIGMPSHIYKGGNEESLAVREIESGKFLVVIYRELQNDGFIITAFLTRRVGWMEKRELIWSAPK